MRRFRLFDSHILALGAQTMRRFRLFDLHILSPVAQTVRRFRGFDSFTLALGGASRAVFRLFRSFILALGRKSRGGFVCLTLLFWRWGKNHCGRKRWGQKARGHKTLEAESAGAENAYTGFGRVIRRWFRLILFWFALGVGFGPVLIFREGEHFRAHQIDPLFKTQKWVCLPWIW